MHVETSTYRALGRQPWLRAVTRMLSLLLGMTIGPARASSGPPPQGVSIRGTVRSTLGDAIPLAIVALGPGYREHFTSESGAFAFNGVSRGTYRLVGRQVGFRPADTLVVVQDSSIDVTLKLTPLVVQLSEISVTAEATVSVSRAHCTAPGPPDRTRDAALADVYEQLRQNAERYWLLADSYPAQYRMARRLWVENHLANVDTLQLRTDTRWRYAPGHLLVDVQGPRGGSEMQVNLPTLPDLADSAFVRVHCFHLVGLDTLDGRRWVRMDFRAWDRLVEPDVDGSAYLDPNNYLIHHATVRLTHPDRALPGLAAFTARVAYREIAPSLLIVDRISAEQSSYLGSRLVARNEDQQLLDVVFLRPLPHE
jgi:hypothetical protein